MVSAAPQASTLDSGVPRAFVSIGHGRVYSDAAPPTELPPPVPLACPALFSSSAASADAGLANTTFR